MLINNYIGIYKPNHHRAMSNGIVYEHILIAEEILGRELKDEEVVHHKDFCRTNNKYDNLMIFATNADHARFHKNKFNKLIKLSDGTYTCEEYLNLYKCPICGKYKSSTSKHCFSCNNKKQTENIPSREKLKETLLLRNFTKIGKMFNVTDNAVRKWCKKYKLPYLTKELQTLTDDYILSL